uniref:Uncharacterized protein n=1 Tax=Heterorhabditis bacteriophora TaxID=37862 RepID=A0A1I7WEH0_HETBA
MICNREDGPLFCGMVRHFGEEAYRRSGNVTLGVAEDFLVSKKNSSSLLSLVTPNPLAEYDYESEVRLNDTAGGSSLQDHADLLEATMKELTQENNHNPY